MLRHKNIYIFSLCIITSLFCQANDTNKEPSLFNIENAVMRIVKKVKNSVVSIKSCNGNSDFARHSGVILDTDGHIVTIASSLRNTKNICVKTLSKEFVPAKLIAIDDLTNLAVIKVENAKNFQSIAKGDSSKLEIGAFLISIGNPYGLQNSASLGIVSGTNRVVKFNDNLISGLIQTTASLNPGDAGGLAVNSRGEFAGVIYSTLGNSKPIGNAMLMPQGINFIIPSNTVYWVCQNLIKYGKVNRGRMGISIKKRLVGNGVVIIQVIKGSSADKMGIEEGDCLLEYNNIDIASGRDLLYQIHHMLAGEVIKFKVLKKDKQIKEIAIILGE